MAIPMIGGMPITRHSLPTLKPPAISDAMVKVWENRHGDPVLYQQWLRAFLDATVRNPDWLIAKNGLYYKLRELVRMDPSVLYILLAGWEYRTVSWLFDLGAQLGDMGMDEMTPSALAVGTSALLPVPAIPYVKPSGRQSEYHPDHLFAKTPAMLSTLARLGVNTAALTGDLLLGETKCMSGMFARGNAAVDMCKWRGVVAQGHDLLIFLFGEHALVLAHVNGLDAKEILTVHRVLFWERRRFALLRITRQTGGYSLLGVTRS